MYLCFEVCYEVIDSNSLHAALCHNHWLLCRYPFRVYRCHMRCRMVYESHPDGGILTDSTCIFKVNHELLVKYIVYFLSLWGKVLNEWGKQP